MNLTLNNNLSAVSISDELLSQYHHNDLKKLYYLIQHTANRNFLFLSQDGFAIKQLIIRLIFVLNCEHPDSNLQFCAKCKSCSLLMANTHPDCFVFNNNSDISMIEQVRNVITFLSLTPSYSKYKIVYVADFDSLNINSNNALLKILEDATHDSVFFFLSKNYNRVLATIKSRCYKYIPLCIQNSKQYNTQIANLTIIENTKYDRFWYAYYNNAPFYQKPMNDEALELCMITLTKPSIENIFNMSALLDKNKSKQTSKTNSLENINNGLSFEIILELLIKFIYEIMAIKYTNQFKYFKAFEPQIITIINKINIQKIFYFYDMLIYLEQYAKHTLNMKLQLENILFNYQQLFT